MSFINVNCIIIAIIFFAVIGEITSSECAKETPCSCHFLDGSHYDLNNLTDKGLLSDSSFNYSSSFQPCKNVIHDMGKPQKVSECDNGVSMCVRHLDEVPLSLGNTTETKWSLSEESYPVLILKHGTIMTRITLICYSNGLSSTLKLDSKPDPLKLFHYTLNSPYVCKKPGPPEGISVGSLLVILLFVFSGVYLLIGALALKFFRGAIGWELIPNYDFWSDLPALVRDGVAYTFSGCSAESYDRI